LCSTCSCNVDTKILQDLRNETLHRLLDTHRSSTSFEWPDEVKEYQIQETAVNALFPNSAISPHLLNSKHFVSDFQTPVKLRILTVPHTPFNPSQKKAIKGGKIGRGYAFDPMTVLYNPGDGSIGLVILLSETGEYKDADFIFLGPSMVRNEDIVKMGAEEDKAIKGMEMGARQGAASCFLRLPHGTSCYDSKSLSKSTHNDRELSRGKKQESTATTLHYSNNDGRRITFSSLYRDMHMTRLNKVTKKKELWSQTVTGKC
jgi:hypothetical protein